MESTTTQQIVIDISYTEQELLSEAATLIRKAMLLRDSTSVRKFEFLNQHIGSVQQLQLLQAMGNLMYLQTWDNLKIESLKSAWCMNYVFKYPPT